MSGLASQENQKKEGTPEATKGDHHSPTSDDSVSPWRKRKINNDSLQGEVQKKEPRPMKVK